MAGTNIFKETSFNILDRFAELGGNFIDTSNAYNEGQSEEIIGEWMKESVLFFPNNVASNGLKLFYNEYNIHRLLRKSNTQSHLNETRYENSLSLLYNHKLEKKRMTIKSGHQLSVISVK